MWYDYVLLIISTICSVVFWILHFKAAKEEKRIKEQIKRNNEKIEELLRR